MGLNAISHGAVSEVADRVRRRRHGALADQLPLAGIEDDGLVLLDDGALVRVFEVQPINTLVLDEPHVERLAAQAHRLLARIPVGQLLSLYVQSEPLRVDRLLAREQTIAARVAAHQIQADGPELGEATRRLAFVEAHSLATHVPILPASRVRYFLAVPLGPAREDRPRRLRRGEPPRTSIDAFETTGDEHARFVSSVLMGLKAMRLSSRALSGPELIDLLWSRCSPDLADHGRTPPSRAAAAPTGSLTNAATPLEAMERAASLKECICQESLEPATRSYLRWEGSVEQVVRLGGLPEETWLGWLQHLTLSTLPFTLAVHFHARDRFREKRRQKRKYKQVWASNRGMERLGKLVDPDRQDAEAEAHDVTATLKRQAASTIYDVGVYLAMREPGGDADRLADELRNASRELTSATDAVINDSPFAQFPLWRSTLPLGIDPVKRGRQYLSVNAADTFPLIGSGRGSPLSPTAIPLGYAQPSRELVWIDPFDPVHPTHVTILTAQSGGGKTMLVNLLVGRSAGKGARGAIIDRSGHYDYPAATIPGAASVRIGGASGAHRINPWDGEPTSRKIAFLLALHDLILNGPEDEGVAHDPQRRLRENLVGLAIRAVYRRCETTGETPRETLLREELLRRYRAAKADGSPELASIYQLLAESLHNYVGDGPYAWMCDHETTVEVDAPLVVYDTRDLPDSEAPAALLIVCESIIRRVEAEREAFLAGGDRTLPWAGRFFLIFEEVWKLIGRSSTGKWVNELARRSRHLALWLIAISQELEDLSGETARALVSQSPLRFVLQHSPDQLGYLRERLDLSEQAADQIRDLQTVKREYAQVYVMNGRRGEGPVTVAVSELEYWRCTSDPIGDEPLRRLALRQVAGGREPTWRDRWAALTLLADPAWNEQHAPDDQSAL